MNKKGFTLIEILIALAIASIISIGFFKVVNMTIKTNVKNEKDIRSLNIAQAEVESLRAQIKNDNSKIKINIDEDENREFIEIDREESWIKNEKGIDILKINEEEYQGEDSNGKKDSSLLKYKRVMDEDKDDNEIKENDEEKKLYTITLGLSREPISNNQVYNQYLYSINVKVEFVNKNISQKGVVFSTKVLENSQ